MNTIKIPKKEVFESWVEDESTIEVDEWATKHDCHRVIYVTKKDDKYWEYSIEYSYNDGAQIWDDFVEAHEVRPVEVKSIKWEKVK